MPPPTPPPTPPPVQRCINPACNASFSIADVRTGCPHCSALLDVDYGWLTGPVTHPSLRSWSFVEQRANPGRGAAVDRTSALNASGVWRFRDLMPFFSSEADICTIGEGKTLLQRADLLCKHLGFCPGSCPACPSGNACSGTHSGGGGLYLQYEGMNPSGSFKDNGMTAAFTHARMVNAKVVACASTGNTSASMAIYAIQAGMKAVIFIGDGKIAFGKLSQALDYGALTLQVAGDFDACLARVKHIAENVPAAGVYLMNSVNPFRLEGQKAVMFRVLEGLNFQVPDWIVVPGGNLGNCSAFGKAFLELKNLGLIDRLPRLAVINAHGASTLDRIYNHLNVRWNQGAYFTDGGLNKTNAEYVRMDAANERAHTVATAIEINRPVNLAKALRALEVMNGSTRTANWSDAQPGVVRSVDDETIKEYKALIGKFGYGCEPASAASLAGAHALLKEGIIKKGQRVVCILTGHQLKDPDVTVGYHTGKGEKATLNAKYANAPIKVPDDLDAILKAMGSTE
ncbi:MAG: threonine synthase [Phycisphaerales bacterium]|nr:threonine synthase [Phycisphaerales bacterium]